MQLKALVTKKIKGDTVEFCVVFFMFVELSLSCLLHFLNETQSSFIADEVFTSCCPGQTAQQEVDWLI